MKFNNDFIIHKKNNDFEYIQFRKINNTGIVKHCITTRRGGGSKNNFSNLNLKYGIGDEDLNVDKNLQKVCKTLDFNCKNIIFSNQIHSDKVKVIDENTKTYNNVDGFITHLTKVPLLTLHADCNPILFLDVKKKIIGNSHAGWRGTVNKIAQKTVLKMKEVYGCNPEDIIVTIGPSIGQCCFETDSDVPDEFNKKFINAKKLYIRKDNKYFVDLWSALKMQLKEVGVREKNILTSNICTKCNNDYFFSYRGDQGETGRIGAFIELI